MSGDIFYCSDCVRVAIASERQRPESDNAQNILPTTKNSASQNVSTFEVLMSLIVSSAYCNLSRTKKDLVNFSLRIKYQIILSLWATYSLCCTIFCDYFYNSLKIHKPLLAHRPQQYRLCGKYQDYKFAMEYKNIQYKFFTTQ